MKFYSSIERQIPSRKFYSFFLKFPLDAPPTRSCIEAIYLSFPLCRGLCTLLNHLAFQRLYRKKAKTL